MGKTLYKVTITLSNGASMTEEVEAHRAFTAMKEAVTLPSVLRFLAENPGETIIDRKAERAWEAPWTVNRRFAISTFDHYQRWIVATDFSTGVAVKFRMCQYDKNHALFKAPAGLGEDDIERSVDDIERWLKAELRELVYTSNDLYKMKQAERYARQMSENGE